MMLHRIVATVLTVKRAVVTYSKNERLSNFWFQKWLSGSGNTHVRMGILASRLLKFWFQLYSAFG